MENIRVSNGDEKYNFHEVLEIWLSPTPHFGGVGPHRYDTNAKNCKYCLRPKNFDAKPYLAEVA